MVQIVQQDAPWSFGFFPYASGAAQSWVHNYKPAVLIRDHGKYLRLDVDERVRKLAEWNQPVWWPMVLGGWRRCWLLACARGAACAGASAPTRAARCIAPDAAMLLHRPPHRLRRADPAGREPGHLLPVLHGQHARRHGAAEHRRQARQPGSRSTSGRPSAATTSRCTATTPRQGSEKLTDTIFWERSVSLFALDFGRADAESAGDIGHEVAHAHVGQPAAGAAAVRAAGHRQHGLRAAAGDVPPHPARLLGRGGCAC